ncbi:MAG: A24 family peptidase C-terminal domain-containing protein [Thermoplasmatota archaeon]
MDGFGSPLDAARFIIGAGVLAYAARTDVLTRRVGDGAWWLTLAAGVVILEAELWLRGEGFLYLLTPFYVIVFFLSLWYEGEVLGEGVRRRDSALVAAGLNLAALLVVAAQLRGGSLDPLTEEGFRHLQLLSIPAMMLLAYILYRTQLLSGGADAKAFLSMSALVPFYPSPLLDLLPAPRAFMLLCPFVLAIFFTAAFLTLLNPLALSIYNLARGDRGPLMAFAYKVPISEAGKKRFIWLSECVEGGRRRHLYFRFRGYDHRWKREQLRLLEAMGERRVWVQPQIPFMVQLWAGFVLCFALGNFILYGIVRLISGL